MERVRPLLREQFPSLASRPITPLANGWDNSLVQLGADLLVRLPRRKQAAHLLEHEQRWLPELAPRLPLPIPTPVHIGRASTTYPWQWSITAYPPGENAAMAPRLDTHRAAGTLGEFLARLHVAAPSDAPINPVRGGALALRDDAIHHNFERAGDAIDLCAARAMWQTALDAEPWQRPPVWLHGDLHPANLIVNDARISAVIDFGDITAGDPATDLAIAWLLLPSQHRPAFWGSYATHAAHDVDTNLELRARGWALAFAALFLAHSADNSLMKRIGLRAAAAALGQS